MPPSVIITTPETTDREPEDIVAVLQQIWAEVLGRPAADLSTEQTFLRLGGDSVLSVRVAAAMRRTLGVQLSLADVGVECTIAELADIVRQRAGSSSGGALPVELVHRADPSAPFALLPLQQGYFVGQHGGWELSYESAHFNADVGLSHVDAEEAEEALADGLRSLAEHQPMVRARVNADGTQRMLAMDVDGAVPVPIFYDLRGADAATVQGHLDTVREDMSRTGPNPMTGPGVDVRLTLLDGHRARLHTAMSLLVFDGWSATILGRELLTLSSDWNARLPPLGLDFGDYAESVRSLPSSPAWSADRDWWWERIDQFGDAPALPIVRDPAEVTAETMGSREVMLDASTYAALRAQCAAHDITTSTGLMVAFSTVLARWAGHRHLLLNSLQFNRLPLHPDVHRVIGAFASTMLLPMNLDRGCTFAELAAHGQRVFAEHNAHTLISGVEVAREAARRRDTRRPIGPIVFQSTLGMDTALGEEHPDSAGPLGLVSFEDYYHQLRTPQVALEMRCYEMRGELALVFSLVDELFDAAAVDAAFAEVTALVRSLAEGGAWDAVVDLPESADAPDDGLRLRLDELTAATSEAGPPADRLEEQIAEQWEDLLEVPVLDRAASFFELGGDSLLAVRALALLARAHAPVPVRSFLDDPTVAGLASAVRRQAGQVS